ncbi:MAG TPA: protein phosphatase 2C domain-containing protein [Gemmataceae bacterium]|nr:protein phosphatase 2C domain-containing protein [Gemmataceae bacterium]
MSRNVPCLRWHAFHTHKRGNAPDEYEDAFACDPAAARFAVADGASESSFAAAWAKLLAEGFVAANGQPWRRLDWLAPLRQRWAGEVDPRPLPWYAEEKREQGAFATLLGVVLTPGSWRALAVGDSCLFRLRGGKLGRTFPLAHSSNFGNQPALLGSRGRPADAPPPGIHRARGRWRPGDRFLLMTDALAEWMLRRHEQKQRPAEDIDQLLAESAPQDAFADWIEERRNGHGLRNDDVTLVVIDL